MSSEGNFHKDCPEVAIHTNDVFEKTSQKPVTLSLDLERSRIYIRTDYEVTLRCTQLIVGDQYSDLETMNFLGAKLVGAVADAPSMWTLCATPRAVMDALQERGFELKLAQIIENNTTWIMSKPDEPSQKPVQKQRDSPPPTYEAKMAKIQSEDSMHSMPRGPRKVPVKTKHQSKEGVEMAMTVAGAEPPHDEKHHQSNRTKGEKRQLYDADGNPVQMGSVDSMAPAESENDTYTARPTSGKTRKAESEHDTYSARPTSGKTRKPKSRPDTPATYDVKQHPSKHSDSSDEEDHRTVVADDPGLTVKKRKSPVKEKKKSSPKRGSKRSLED